VQQSRAAFTKADEALPTMVNGVMPEVPETIEDAFAGPHAYHWRKAVQAELDSMAELNVFELADAPLDRKPLTAKWVFTWKANAQGQIVKAKARLVARGFQQKEGQDYSELFAPTVSQVTFKVLMAHAASHNLLVHQLDVKTAFLYGDLEEVLYMQQPPGCADGSGRVWRLLKSLYGLKQSPRQWHQKLKSELENLGYVQSLHDPALFYRLESDSYRSYLIMHVDDLLIAHGDIHVINTIKSELSTVFTITDLGIASKYLGIEVAQHDAGIFIHQTAYVRSMCSTYSHLGIDLKTIPLPSSSSFTKLDSPYSKGDAAVPADTSVYASLVGTLMYLAVNTRPDIAYAVNTMCQYMSAPSVAHLQGAVHIASYVANTADVGIWFSAACTQPLLGYCDSSFAANVDNRRSCMGYCFTYNGSVVAWKSKLQDVIAKSTMEAEYMCASAAGTEAVWLSRLVGEFKPTAGQACLIHCDNMSALHLMGNHHPTNQSKHIDVAFHWAREKVHHGLLKYAYVPGADNMSDIFTKALPRPKFEMCRDKMNLCHKFF
jgi:hypothetical protein